MKKLIFIAATCMMFSCAKEQCWECEITLWGEGDRGVVSKETEIRCGYTRREIRQIEKEETCQHILANGKSSGIKLECKKF